MDFTVTGCQIKSIGVVDNIIFGNCLLFICQYRSYESSLEFI